MGYTHNIRPEPLISTRYKWSSILYKLKYWWIFFPHLTMSTFLICQQFLVLVFGISIWNELCFVYFGFVTSPWRWLNLNYFVLFRLQHITLFLKQCWFYWLENCFSLKATNQKRSNWVKRYDYDYHAHSNRH